MNLSYHINSSPKILMLNFLWVSVYLDFFTNITPYPIHLSKVTPPIILSNPTFVGSAKSNTCHPSTQVAESAFTLIQ